ncbi:MAG: hypothetical protein WAO20_22250, partial [Acidobacteriota bacterium]
LKDLEETQIELINETTRAAETLTGSLDRLELISGLLGQASEKILEAGAQLELSASASVDAQKSAIEAQQELLSAAQSHTEAMTAARKELSAAWDEAVQNAKGAIHQIQEAARELREGIADQLVRALHTFDGALGETIGRFSGTLAQVDDSIGELAPAANSIRSSCDEMRNQTEALAQTMQNVQKLVEGLVAKNVTEAATAASALSEVVGSTGRILAQEASLREELARTLSHLGQLGKDLETVNTTLTSAKLTDLGESLRPLAETLRGIQTGLNGSDPAQPLGARLSLVVERVNELSRALESLNSRLGEKRGLFNFLR